MTDVYDRAKADDEKWEREHGADSREKLERDIREKCELNSEWVNFVTVAEAIGWLDRQVAITERHWMEISGANTLANIELNKQREELQRKVDELTDELDEAQRQADDYKERKDDYAQRIAELQAALNTAEADNEFLRDELGSEPFCSQVKRWLNGDAPKECLECDEGCYRELLAKECDTCQPMVDAEREIAGLKEELSDCRGALEHLDRVNDRLRDELDDVRSKYDDLLERRTKVECDCDCCKWRDELKKLDELQAKYDALRERRGKAMPDGYEWPRFNDGKPLEIGDRYVFEGCAVRTVRRICFDHTEKGLYGDGKPYMEIDTEHETRVYPMGYEFWHAEPRTIEDVLREFGWECANNCGADPDDVAKYADEIRRLM